MKKELRDNVLAIIKNKDKYSQENRIYFRLFNHSYWKSAKTIGITMSMPHEIDTMPIIRMAHIENKRIFVPECDYNDRTMQFAQYTHPTEIYVDHYGINAVSNPTNYLNEPDLIIVPGVVFNQKGYRIGYGGGFYDRFLLNFKGHTISFALDEQMAEFEHEKHDIPVEYLITPSKEYHFNE